MSKHRFVTQQPRAGRPRSPRRALWHTLMAAALLSGGVLTPGMMAWANSPAPGTVIENQATGSFVDPGDNSTQLIESNVVQVTVAEVAGITVTNVGYTEPTDGTVNNGDTVYFDFVVTNVGNDPTQFFIPGAPSAISGGTAGTLEIIAYDADGTGAGTSVDLSGENITVPAPGETTGNLLGATANNGSIPSGGSITVRVPVTVTGAEGTDVSVTLGNTAAPPNNQNQPYTTPPSDTENVYTVDNLDGTSGETADPPINGEREASDSLTVAITVPPEYNLSGQVRNDTDNDGDLNDTDSGISGVIVTLYDDIDGDGDPTGSTQITTDTTDGSGNYIFENLAPGNYIIIETDPGGFTSTNDSDGFNNNRIAINLASADSAGNNFLDSNTPVPGPPSQICNATYGFTWGAGGAVWNIGDNSNAYANVGGSGITVTVDFLDPDNQNIDFGNPGTGSSYTRTDGAYGPGYLTWAMTSQNANQTTSFVFRFSEPILIDDLQVIDIDGVGYGFQPTAEPGDSFQDELSVTAELDGINIPVSVIPEAVGTMTVVGQTARGNYPLGTTGNLSHTDPRGHMLMSTTVPVNYLRLDYSNGPADARSIPNGDGVGISDDHAIAIDKVFSFCEALPRNISGQVREDIDGDGDLDDIDSGLDNVTIQLFSDPNGDGNSSDGTLIDSKITDVNGNFSFINVDAGNYVIVENNSVGFSSTADSAGSNDDRISVSVSTTDSTNNIFLDTTTPIASDPNILLVKRITALNDDTNTSNGDNLSAYIDQEDIVYPYDDNTIAPVSDPNDAAYDPNDAAFDPRETDQWPTPLSTNLRGGIDGGDVMPNDEIEYTIYYLSSGDADAKDVLICDYVPEFTSFIPSAFNGLTPQAPGGITSANLSIEVLRNGASAYYTGADDGDSAIYYGPGDDPAGDFPGIDCEGDGIAGNANPNGAIVVNLGDITNASAATSVETESYGYVRFRARVK
ncbi:MAG: SdrD B-like domain-containing protein [Cyanobacteria bacterium J06635_1]